MKIVVIGGTGLIGSKTMTILNQRGHAVIAASPKSGINTITGEGHREAMDGAEAVVDLANSPSFEDKAVLEFFETSGRNLLAAESAAAIQHHVALSIVGIDRTDNGYFGPRSPRRNSSRCPPSPTRSSDRPSFSNSSAASPIQARMETSSGYRPSCSSLSRRKTLRRSWPRRRSRRLTADRGDRRAGTSAV